MRTRRLLAFSGLMIIAIGGLIGFAAFSTDGQAPPTTVASAELPTEADGRVAAAAFAAMLQGTLAPATLPAPTTEPPPTQAPETTAAPETAPESTSEATSAPAPEASAAAAATSPPAPTTAAPATAAPTTTTAAPTTTTAPPPPPTTEPPVEGGPRDVEAWRGLVAQHFAAERVDEALRIIQCESRGDPTAVNPYSGASGLFQFMASTWTWASAEAGWAGASVFDPEANTAAAAWLVQTSIETAHPGGAWGHWTCSPN